MTIKPPLAEDANLDKAAYPLIAEPKIDGVRAMNLQGTLTGRSLDPFKGFGITEFFSRPEFVGFDGEMTLGDDPMAPRLCSLTTGAMGKFKGVTQRADFHWWLFDYITEQTLSWPYMERYEFLRDTKLPDLARKYPFLHLVPMDLVLNRYEADAITAQHLDAGFEGTIWRNPKSPVKQGRSTQKGEYWRSKPWSDFEIKVTGVTEGSENTNEAKKNTLGRTERSFAKDGLVPNGQIGSLQGIVLADVKDHNGKVLFPEGLPITAGSGEMSVEEATAWFKDQTQIVGHIAKIKHMTFGVKDLPRFPTFLSKRLPQDMSK